MNIRNKICRIVPASRPLIGQASGAAAAWSACDTAYAGRIGPRGGRSRRIARRVRRHMAEAVRLGIDCVSVLPGMETPADGPDV